VVPEVAVVGLLVAFPLVGFVIPRWSAVGLPLVGWPLYFLGLNEGWWGYGTGDNWQYGAVLLTAIGIATTALMVALRRSIASGPRLFS
jgi:hypothetical protein